MKLKREILVETLKSKNIGLKTFSKEADISFPNMLSIVSGQDRTAIKRELKIIKGLRKMGFKVMEIDPIFEGGAKAVLDV